MSKKITTADFEVYPSYSRRAGAYKHTQVKDVLSLEVGEGMYYDAHEYSENKYGIPRFVSTLYGHSKRLGKKFSMKKITSGVEGDKKATGYAILRVS